MKQTELRLGPRIALPLDITGKKLAFLGTTGSGKSYAAGKLAEQMLEVGAQIIVLDPVGIWYGLRIGRDGKSAGYQIPVFGGIHGDIPRLVITEEQLSRLERSATHLETMLMNTNTVVIAPLLEMLGAVQRQSAEPRRQSVPEPPRPTPQARPSAPPSVKPTSNGHSPVSGMARKIMTVLAQHQAGMGLDRLAILAGSTVSGHFNNTLGGLRSSGYVTPARVIPIQATREGLAALGSYEPLPTGRALRQYWLNRMSGGLQGKIFQALIDTYPRTLALEELAAACGSTVSGHFNNTVGSLRTMGLMTPARTPIKASDDLFR